MSIIPTRPKPLRNRYRDGSRSQSYIDRCLLLADCCVALKQNRSEQSAYYWETAADYNRENLYFNFVTESELIKPSLCFCKFKLNTKDKIKDIIDGYLLELFDANLQRLQLGKRLRNYLKYIDEDQYEWEDRSINGSLPTILLVCPRLTDMIYAKRRVRRLIADIEHDSDPDHFECPRIWLATIDKLKAEGIFSTNTWEVA